MKRVDSGASFIMQHGSEAGYFMSQRNPVFVHCMEFFHCRKNRDHQDQSKACKGAGVSVEDTGAVRSDGTFLFDDFKTMILSC